MNRLISLCFPLLLAACSTAPDSRPWLTYRIDIRQGNMVTQKMVAQLKPGLTRDQVRFLLGTPLVADVFHADRWDYVYRFQPGRLGAETEQRHLVVFFKDGKLDRVGGDVLASNASADTSSQSVPRVIDIAPAGQSAN